MGFAYLDAAGLARLWAKIKEYVASRTPEIWRAARTPGELYKSSEVPTSTVVGKYDGYLYATRVYNAVWNDYAELFPSASPVAPGSVAYAGDDGRVAPEGEPRRAVGVASDRYGHLIGGLGDPDAEGWCAVALAGRVPLAVSGDVRVGDLVAAAGNGTGRRARMPDDAGALLGKCVGPDPDGRPGYIDVLVGVG